MDLEWICDLFVELVFIKVAIKIENSEFSRIIKTHWKSILVRDLGQALRVDKYQKTVSKSECLLEVIFNGYRLHVGSHFGFQKYSKSMPKLGCDFRGAEVSLSF